MKVLHISDLHFNSGSYHVEPYKIEKGLINLIKSKRDEEDGFYLIVSGDITTAGTTDGFSEAKSFFENILNETNIKKENFLVCPGNHDIANDSFEAFDSFSYGIRHDNVFTFKKNHSNIFFHDKNCFISINTSYHLDYKFGKIDISQLSKLLKENAQEINNSKIKIILFHHHLLNILDDDNSAIKNSYNFFHMINRFKFDFIFHGHQHARQLFDINNTKINSISALLDNRASSNLIAYYELEESSINIKEEYVYLKDEINEDGTRGSYKKIC